MDASWLAVFWAALIAFAILVYVLLDGFDLGIGVLFGTTRDQNYRGQMLTAIAPFWDGNETWLVIIGASLFGAFPMVYAIFLPAFYLPVALLLLGLIFRGVAFEFRYRTERMRWLWDWGFFLGALIAGFVQGVAIGTMVQELPVVDGRFAGGVVRVADAVLGPVRRRSGAGLCASRGHLAGAQDRWPARDWAYRRVRWLLCRRARVPGAGVRLRRDQAPSGHGPLVRSALAARVPGDRCARGPTACGRACKGSADWLPYAMAVVIFLAAYLTLVGSFWPYMIPFSVTIWDAAAPPQSLSLPVLRRGARGLSGRADLHGRGVLDLPRQGA